MQRLISFVHHASSSSASSAMFFGSRGHHQRPLVSAFVYNTNNHRFRSSTKTTTTTTPSKHNPLNLHFNERDGSVSYEDNKTNRNTLAKARGRSSKKKKKKKSPPITSTTRTMKSSKSQLDMMISSSYDNNALQQDELEALEQMSGYKRPTVNWYPGHIGKAERMLSETLKVVDVIVEVRDARICKATSHPRVGEWCQGKPRIVVLTHLDMIPKLSLDSWTLAYEKFGAENWDSSTTKQIQNIANQAILERMKYNNNDNVLKNKINNKKKGSNKKKTTTTNNNNNSISPVHDVIFVNAKQGNKGFHKLHKSIYKAGEHVHVRREKRGLKVRPLRVGIIGYPNVGKSALINRILGKRRARTANTPGITRTLQWIRVRNHDKDISTSTVSSSSSATSSASTGKKEFELLDSPGIIPANMEDQSDALLLAACNCIGEAAYDNQGVASYLMEWIKTLCLIEKDYITAPKWRDKCLERYKFDPLKPINDEIGTNFNINPASAQFGMINNNNNYDENTLYYMTGEDMLHRVADNTCKGDLENASRKILQDFRTGRLGPISLQLAPSSGVDDDDEAGGGGHQGQGQTMIPIKSGFDARIAPTVSYKEQQKLQAKKQLENNKLQQERATNAMNRAKEYGLELPPTISLGVSTKATDDDDDEVDNDDATTEKKKRDETTTTTEEETNESDDIGKGMFDGW